MSWQYRYTQVTHSVSFKGQSTLCSPHQCALVSSCGVLDPLGYHPDLMDTYNVSWSDSRFTCFERVTLDWDQHIQVEQSWLKRMWGIFICLLEFSLYRNTGTPQKTEMQTVRCKEVTFGTSAFFFFSFGQDVNMIIWRCYSMIFSLLLLRQNWRQLNTAFPICKGFSTRLFQQIHCKGLAVLIKSVWKRYIVI